MEIFATEQIAAELELFALSMRKVLGWGVQRDMAPLGKIAEVMKTKMRGRKKRNFF